MIDRYEEPNESSGSRMEHIARDLKPSGKPFLANGTNHWTTLWAVSAINCLPAGTAPNESNQRRASSLSSTYDGLMAQMPPGLPFGMPIGAPSGRQHCLPRAPNRCHAQWTHASCQKLTCSEASFKLERARSSAPQLSRAFNDTKQADFMRWLGENHDLLL